MDASILLRLVPAVAAATLVAAHAHPTRRLPVGSVVDEVIRVLLVGALAGRLGWLLLGGPQVWSTALTTAVLVRAGVETGIGLVVAAIWVGRRDDGERHWRLLAAVPATLAGVATWQALCQVEGVCGGVPVSWGVRLPGRAVPTFPAAWVEAGVLVLLLVVAWRFRGRPAPLWWLGSGAAVARVLIGFGRPALVSHPTRDQVLFAVVAVGCAAVAVRVGRERTWRVGVAPERRLQVDLSPGTGPVVVLAHGVGSSAAFVREAFEAPLVEAGWRLCAVDLRGHGGSDPAPDAGDHALSTHAADLAVVAREFDARIVGGVSIGAMAAVRAAADLHVDAVVAVIPGWTGPAQKGQGPHAAVADEVRSVGVGGMLDRLEADPGLPAWIREVVLRDYRRHDRASLEAALLALDGGDGPGLDEVRALRVPVALVGWPDDPGHPLAVAESWRDAAGHAALVVTSIPAMQDDRTAFGRAALEALERLGVSTRLR